MTATLPTHDQISRTRHALSAVWLAAATTLLAWHVVRIARSPSDISWRVAVAALFGILIADFLSGLVHWAADTWGSIDMPLVGRRLLHPFRVHHVNPDDFLRRSFLDTNGDLAAIFTVMLAVATAIPVANEFGLATNCFVTAFSAAGLFTNQFHQWAHMPAPPKPVRWLQRCRLILPAEVHQQHHRAPYASHYCITTGWCNRPLAAVDFFRRAERLVTRLTGAKPRGDDAAFSDQPVGGNSPPFSSSPSPPKKPHAA